MTPEEVFREFTKKLQPVPLLRSHHPAPRHHESVELGVFKRCVLRIENEMPALGLRLDKPDYNSHKIRTPTMLLPKKDKALIYALRCLVPFQMTIWLAFLALATLIPPAAAVDFELVPAGAFATTNGITQSHIPEVATGTCTAVLFVFAGYLIGAARSMLGPLMGVSSVLWFIMRNDAAVKPGLSWMVFCAWSVFTLMYFALQCQRVAHHGLYVLLSQVFAGVCLCVVALVQRSSINGGLVTAIPPCTSFAAYAVAFFFPDRPRRAEQSAV